MGTLKQCVMLISLEAFISHITNWENVRHPTRLDPQAWKCENTPIITKIHDCNSCNKHQKETQITIDEATLNISIYLPTAD